MRPVNGRIALSADAGAAVLVAELTARGHEVRALGTPDGFLSLVNEWAPQVVVLLHPAPGFTGRVRRAAPEATLVLVTDAAVDADAAEALGLHGVLGEASPVGMVVVAVESALRRASEHAELSHHQDLLRRMLGLATGIARLGSPEEVASLALDGFVGALADSAPPGLGGVQASGVFAVQLGPGAPIRYFGAGHYSGIEGELDLSEAVDQGLVGVFGRAGVTGRGEEQRRVFLGIHGAGDVRGAVMAEGVEVPGALDDLVAIFGGLLGQALGNAVLYQRSTFDGLTGLYTRTMGLRRLGETLGLAGRYPSVTTVLVLDVDHFKRVNDTLGHAAGDLVLVALADLIRATCRNTDIPARLGGEEFVVILPRTDEAAGALVAERLRRVVAAWRGSFEGAELSMTISIGVAAADPGEVDGAALVGRADDALYVAKRDGRNRVVRAS